MLDKIADGKMPVGSICLIKKGSYRAVYEHPTDQTLLWKVGGHGEEAAWLKLYGSYKGRFPFKGDDLRVMEVERLEPLPKLERAQSLLGLAEMVMLDAGSWEPAEPGPLKNLRAATGACWSKTSQPKKLLSAFRRRQNLQQRCSWLLE